MSDTMIPTWTLGDRLAKARKIAGLNTLELADKLGISRNTITNYEKGHTHPSRAIILAYESVTGVPAWWIEDGEDAEHAEEPVTQREYPCWSLDSFPLAA